MRGYTFFAILNALIAIPAITALTRFKVAKKWYFPFILFIWIGCINEFVSILLAYTKGTSAANSNIYVLVEFVLILLQFLRWRTISKVALYTLFVTGLMVWVLDNLVINSISGNNSIFRIFYSLIIVFCSINQVNKLIIGEQRLLLKHPTFLICVGFLVFYLIKAFIEVFNAFHLTFHDRFNRNLFMGYYLINLITNLIYTIAIICIPKKQVFTLP